MNEAAASMHYLGILTGISYVSGIDYYRGLNERVASLIPRERCAQMPKNSRVVMATVDCDTYVNFLNTNDQQGCARYLIDDGVTRLVRAGAEVLVIASNTAHLICPQVEKEYPSLRVLHIGDCIAHAIKKKGMTHVGLLGTKPTMEGSWLKDRLKAHGITAVIPKETATLQRCYDIIVKELSFSVFTPESRAFYVECARRLIKEDGAQGVILGCTEIELLVRAGDCEDVVLFPSAEIHIDAAARLQVGQLQLNDIVPPSIARL